MTNTASSSVPKYIIASVQIWNELRLKDLTSKSGNWKFCQSPSELDEILHEFHPEYIFFLHWRWIVPKNIIDNYECVCFHMTDLPFGRGGSPLQNLISRGISETKLTSLKMTDVLDGGPIYYKEPLTLNGTAREIYERAESLSIDMVTEIIEYKPNPKPQVGTPVFFKRRTPDQSELLPDLTSKELFDYIRMLDAPGYPKAFCISNGYKISFSGARLTDTGKVTANVEFKIESIKDNKKN